MREFTYFFRRPKYNRAHIKIVYQDGDYKIKELSNSFPGHFKQLDPQIVIRLIQRRGWILSSINGPVEYNNQSGNYIYQRFPEG